MTTVATIAAELILDAAKFTSGMKDAEKSADNFSGRMDEIGDKMTKIGGIMTASLTLPIVAFGTSAVKAAMESEAAIANLESTIESTGNKTGITSAEFQKMATELQNMSGFSDEAIMDAQTMLLTFDEIGKTAMPRATEATLDLSRRFGMDLHQASIMLGKALQDPADGLGALSRVGVTFTDSQKQMVEQMMEVGDVAGAQAIIFEAVEAQVKGAAEAYGKTAAGQFDIFRQKLDGLKEAIGTALIPSLIRLMDAITPIIEMLANNPIAVDFLVAVMGFVAAAGPLTTAFGLIAKVIAFFSAGGGGAAAVTWITTTLIPALGSIGTFITATLIPAIIPLLPLLALIAASVLLVWLVWKNWDKLKVTLSQLGTIIKVGLIAGVQKLGQAAKTVGASIKSAFSAAWEAVKLKASEIIESIKQKIQSLFDKGKQLVNGFVSGFKSGFGAILNFAKTVFGGIASAISKLIGYVRQLASSLLSLKLPAALTPGSPTPFEIGLLGIADAMKAVRKNSDNMRNSIKENAAAATEFFKTYNEKQATASKNNLTNLAGGYKAYYKTLTSLIEQNTKNHAAAMKAQAQATQNALKAQAQAMAAYNRQAAAFWSGANIPVASASTVQKYANVLVEKSATLNQEQLGNIVVEQIKNIKVEKNMGIAPRANTTYVDNRRFNGGMSRDELQTALDSRMAALAGGI